MGADGEQSTTHKPKGRRENSLLDVGLGPQLVLTHFWFRIPMKSCCPTRAKMLRQKSVRIMTSTSFFTERSRAPTITFRPEGMRHLGRNTPQSLTRMGKGGGGVNDGLRGRVERAMLSNAVSITVRDLQLHGRAMVAKANRGGLDTNRTEHKTRK